MAQFTHVSERTKREEEKEKVKNYLEANRQSTAISLSYTALSDDGATQVAGFVRDNPFVRYLDLRGNNLQNRGVTALANGIKINRSLRGLNLKWNGIGDNNAGFEHLCEALKGNLTILHVDFRNNRINTTGAKHIAEMIRGNNTISHIDMSWNNFGVEGGLALLEGMKRNHSLVECLLNGCKVGEEVLSEVAYLLRRNKAAIKANEDELKEQPADAGGDKPKDAAGYPVAPQGQLYDESTGEFRYRTARDDSRLMLGLLIREREEKLPEEKLFYQQVTKYIEKLLEEAKEHKKGQAAGQEREKLATTGFVEREERYHREIRDSEEAIKTCLVDNDHLQAKVASLAIDLRDLNLENFGLIRENMTNQEHDMAHEQQLRKDLRHILQMKYELTDKLALLTNDLQMLDEESERLRVYVANFQKTQDEILGE